MEFARSWLVGMAQYRSRFFYYWRPRAQHRFLWRFHAVHNRFHRIHHSIQPEHYDKNFGVFTTLWDVLFGTAWLPAPGEWPDTGVADMPEPRTVSDFYFAPFRSDAEAAPSAPQTASGGS